MAKIVDRLLLFLFSFASLIGIAVLLVAAFGWIPLSDTNRFVYNVYSDTVTAAVFIISCFVFLLIAFRMLYLSVRADNGAGVPSIDQRTEFGDIRISLETVENLALKAAGRVRGLKDLRSRVRVTGAGLEIVIRAVVDGESSIPAMTEEVQAAVKEHLELITGVPVAQVSVFVANVAQSSHSFRSRVE